MRIVWTARGNKALEYIFTCSRDFYSTKTLKNLNNNLKKIEKILPENPLLGAIEPIAEGLEYEYRHIVLTYPFKLIYFIWNDCIYISDIWDTRQSPVNHKSHLE